MELAAAACTISLAAIGAIYGYYYLSPFYQVRAFMLSVVRFCLKWRLSLFR